MISLVPIANQESVVGRRRIKWHRNHRSTKDLKATIAAGGLVKGKGREVEKASDLVLGLHFVCEVASRGNGAIGAVNTVLPRVPSLLHSVPGS